MDPEEPDFFGWRDQILIELGPKTGGLANSTKRTYISVFVLIAEFRFQKQTRFKRPPGKRNRQNTGFHDIPIIVRLRQTYSDYPLDKAATKRKIQKNRCISWPEALVVCEKQRRQALIYYVDSRDRSQGRKYVRRRRELSGIALDMQKLLTLDFSLFMPTDRQQTYRRLRYGHTLKSGYFAPDGETFIEQDIPVRPNKAQFWLNLEEYKTAQTYGQFWYPIPNITFIDGTTFYEFIAAWLWGFEDTDGNWPVCYDDAPLWQGYIDCHGSRGGWREALAPKGYDYLFIMPIAKTPFSTQAFCISMQNVFTRFTQETGQAVKVAPHSLRHMLSSYIDRLDLSETEKQSFAYVLHHSPETHEESYVYRDRAHLVNPAANRMAQLLSESFYIPQ